MFLLGYITGTVVSFVAVAIIIVINKAYHRIINK